MSSEDTALTNAEQLSLLIQDSQKEYDQIQRELKEIDVLIRQSTVEVEKLAQRNTQATNRVRQMEMNLDTYPRNDIKEFYSLAHEANMRLFMMRGQLEQLQNRQQGLEQQTQENSVPAGAPGRTPPDLSNMTTREKINYGLNQSRKEK